MLLGNKSLATEHVALDIITEMGRFWEIRAIFQLLPACGPRQVFSAGKGSRRLFGCVKAAKDWVGMSEAVAAAPSYPNVGVSGAGYQRRYA